MPWTDTFRFDDPFLDVRGDPAAKTLGAELRREVSLGHRLYEGTWTVVARALPQDEVVAVCGEDVALVHLTWSKKAERPPWPDVIFVASPDEFLVLIEDRY